MTSRKPSLIRQNTENGQEDVQTMRVVSDAEERSYADWITQALCNDDMCKKYFPLDHNLLYESCADGVLFCKMINYSVHDTIDVRAINVGKKLESIFCKNENLSLAVQSASSIGCCVVNIGPIDLGKGIKHIVLGLLWQIIRIGLIGKINLTSHAELVALLRPGETLDDLKQLSPEEILIRWVNYHMEKAQVSRRIANFNTDIMDSEIYSYLLNQIAPDEYRSKMMNPDQILKSINLVDRAQKVLQNADAMKAKAFVEPNDIAMVTQKGKNREKLNMAFVAHLFNNYPALHITEKVIQDFDIVEETLEEKTYRNWINSMGVEPFVKYLYSDLRNGLALLHLIDVIKPGTVKWETVYKKLNPMKKLFQMQDNCVAFINYAKQLNIKLVGLSAENIRESEQTLVLGLCFQMLRIYNFRLLQQLQPPDLKRSIEDRDIIEWANKHCKDAGKPESAIKSFKDHNIRLSKPILDLIECIKPNSVDYSLITNDPLDDAKYAITIARKIGANVYALPQHIVDLNQKMIFTIYGCLMLVDLQKNKS